MRGWLIGALLLALCAATAGAQRYSNGVVTLRALGRQGAYEGFEVVSKGHAVATVRFSSDRLLTAGWCESRKSGGLQFGSLKPKPGCGLQMGAQDRFMILLKPKDPYPSVWFDLTIRTFDPVKWQKVTGKQPFHFLALSMDDAEVWHHRGWLNATPLADPFPLLLDTHVGTPEISAYPYNRTWSYTPPLSAHPLPVIGLWAPRARRYAGFEFQTTRLADNSERDVATGYHWVESRGESRESIEGVASRTSQVASPEANDSRLTTHDSTLTTANQFVALVYPYGGQGYQQLVFPKAGDRIASHGVLLWSDRLPSTDDPNRFFVSYLWARAKDRLPRVPTVVDMSWLPGGIRLRDFEGPPQGGLIGGVEGPFQVPGSKVMSGWRWQNENPVMTAKAQGNQGRMQFLREEARRLLPYVKRFKAGGEECVFWEKPLEGAWTPQWGGKPATTLHNANGFAAGRLFLGLYRDAGMKEYLPIVDGVFNWAKQIVWTRNEFADVPSSPFAIGGTLTASFCLDYYMAFHSAPDAAHRARARQALELARAFTYRYLVLWLSDNNRYDNLHPAFLWEPNSGRDWTGAACSNEVFWNLDTLAQTAVHTGDSALMWALQGSLERWYLMYQEKYKDSLANYQPSDMTEGYGLAPGNVYGVGVRAPYGFASPLAMIEPVGDSVARVLAGEKAAMCFNKEGAHTTIGDYRYTAPGNLAFTLHSRLPGRFDVSITVPYVDMRGKTVSIRRNGQVNRLPPDAGSHSLHPAQAPWSLYLSGVQNGDRVIVGAPEESGPVLASLPPLTLTPPATATDRFRTIRLPYDAVPDTDWNRLDSWAGLPRGTLWAYGIPFALAPEGRPAMLTQPARFRAPIRTKVLLLAYSQGEGERPAVVYADGRKAPVNPSEEMLAWRAWPPIYTSRLVIGVVQPDGPVVGVDPGRRAVFAATALSEEISALARTNPPRYAAEIKPLLEAKAEGIRAWQQLQREEQAIAAMQQEVAAIPEGSVAVLPPNPSGPVLNLGLRAGLAKRGVALTPEQLADPGFFNAQRFPVALYGGGEDYIHTVRAPGDAADNMVRYVREGGALVLASLGPFPMFYGTGGGPQRPGPLTGRLGIPIGNALEALPNEKLHVEIVSGQALLPGLPARFSFPPGDPRLRAIDRAQIPAGAKYTPLARIVGETGRDYGDAAGLVELPGGGRILYVWGGLLRDPQYGASISGAVLRYSLRAARKE